MTISTSPINVVNGFRASHSHYLSDRDSNHRFTRPVLDDVVTALLRGEGRGVILAGEYGVGKTFVARQVLENIAPESLVISLRCSSSTESIEYGAISPLMSNFGRETLDSPMAVLQGATKFLNEHAGGRDVVIFIDNVQNLDKGSALILTQLTVNGVIRLLAACQSLTEVPLEIVGLWRDGIIRRIDIMPFSLPEARQWFESFLGAKVSEAAARALWSAGGGVPRFLDVIIHEQVEARILVKTDDVWVVTGEAFVCGSNGIDTVMTALGSVSDSERMLAEILALSGGMPLNQLMNVGDVAALDMLQQRGYLDISQDELAYVRLSNWLMAKVLRKQVPAGRSRGLRRMVLDSAEANNHSISPGFAAAIWSLDCGVPLDFEQTLVAAKDATQSGSPREALRLLEALSGAKDRPGILVELVRARIALGESSKARTLVFNPEFRVSQLPDRQWVDVMFLRAALARSQDQVPENAGDILDSVSVRLASREASDGSERNAATESELLDMREDLALGMVEQAIHEGRYKTAIRGLHELHKTGRSSETRVLAGSWLVQALTLTGSVVDAARISREIDLENLEGDVGFLPTEATGSALVSAVVASLSAERIGRHNLWAPAGMFMGTRGESYAELSEGLVAAYSGSADKALECLLPAASQLKELGEIGTWSLAVAAIAYACALKGDNDMALEYLNQGKSRVVLCARLLSTACSYFQVLASAELASKEKAVVRLFSLADEERQYRTTAVEMVFVNAAVRLGNVAGAQRLLALATGLQGSLARLCEGFGRGLVNRDVSMLVKVAEVAARQGDTLFSRDVARAALKIAGENADRVGMRFAQQLIRGGMLKLGQVKVSDEDGQRLTGREKEVAVQAASGASNKDIAAKMHISVRTVEGHLYQIYSKLQVASRAELRETLV